MAREVTVRLLCDWKHGTQGTHDASQTLSVGLFGQWYEIDVCDQGAAALEREVSKWTEMGRQADGDTVEAPPSRPVKAPSKAVGKIKASSRGTSSGKHYMGYLPDGTAFTLSGPHPRYLARPGLFNWAKARGLPRMAAATRAAYDDAWNGSPEVRLEAIDGPVVQAAQPRTTRPAITFDPVADTDGWRLTLHAMKRMQSWGLDRATVFSILTRPEVVVASKRSDCREYRCGEWVVIGNPDEKSVVTLYSNQRELAVK